MLMETPARKVIMPNSKPLSRLMGNILPVSPLCRDVLVSKLRGLKIGHVTLQDCEQKWHFGETHSPLQSIIKVLRPSFYPRIVIGGSIGTGESFVDGDWECSDLTALVRIFVLNRDVLNRLDGGLGKLLIPFQKMVHGLKSNTVDQARDNIRSHYDIGNDFFKLFLDPTMMYSNAIFNSEHDTLEQASIEKNDRICRKLNITSKDHVIEIGTGWGGFAVHAAKTYGCKVTTTTISQEQFNMAKLRIEAAGLQDKVTLLLEDYRTLRGQYDKLVSIEMIEAVGLKNLPGYFEQCSRLLKQDGKMLIQAITIRDQYYDQAKTSVDFIQRHIFPGGSLPAVGPMMKAVKEKTDMVLFHYEDITSFYAKTLHLWHVNLKQNVEGIKNLGYPEYLIRLWEFYFCYCEGGFLERAIGSTQFILTKPMNRTEPILGDV